MKQKSEHAQAAAILRAELKKTYPRIKFKVTSQSYTGGNSLDVSWINGPTDDAVQSIADKYQYGKFDSMTDCYNYNSEFSGVGVKYVFAQRTVTDDIKNQIENTILENYGIDKCFVGSDFINGIPERMSVMIHRFSIKLDLTNGLI